MGREIQDPEQPCGTKCRNSDAALFEFFDNSRIDNFGRIARTSTGIDVEAWPDSLFSVRPPFPPYPTEGDDVYGSGKTTGRWSAEVVDTSVDVDKWPNPTIDYTLKCQDFTDEHGAKGDSGAPMFYWGGGLNTEVEVIGMYIGKRLVDGDSVGVFSSYEALEADFGDLAIGGSPLGPFSIVPGSGVVPARSGSERR